MVAREWVTCVNADKAIKNYIKAINKGIVKVISKMGSRRYRVTAARKFSKRLGLMKLRRSLFHLTPSRIAVLASM